MSLECPLFDPNGEPCARGSGNHYPHVGASTLARTGIGHAHDWTVNGDWNGGPSTVPVLQCVICNAIRPMTTPPVPECTEFLNLLGVATDALRDLARSGWSSPSELRALELADSIDERVAVLLVPGPS